MTPDALKAAIQEALQAQFNAGAAVTRLSMIFDVLHPEHPEPETQPEAPTEA